jgi:hypothetical protein
MSQPVYEQQAAAETVRILGAMAPCLRRQAVKTVVKQMMSAGEIGRSRQLMQWIASHI